MYSEQKILTDISAGVLTNGFKSILSPNKAHPIVSLQLYVRMGSCWEKEGEAGYSHLLEHLVFKSTKKYPKNSLTAKAMYLGSNINAYTEFDSTCFYLTLPSRFLEEGVELLAELSRYANWSQDDFDCEKNVVLEEIAYYQNDPEDYFIEKIPALYFPESPYKKPIIGTKESIGKATNEDLKNFYQTHYTADNSFLIVSGDFDKDKLLPIVNNYFASWQSSQAVDRNINNKTIYPQQLKYANITKKVSKPILAFAVPEPSNPKEQSFILDIIVRIFANDKKSRLYKRLFIKEQLVEQLKVESFSGICDGVSVIIAVPKKSVDVELITEIFMDEFDRLKNISYSDINEAKNEMINAHRYTLEYAKGIGFSLGTEEILGNYRNFIDYLDTISNISEQDILDTINTYFCRDKLGIYCLTGKDRGLAFEDFIAKKIKNVTKKVADTNLNYYKKDDNVLMSKLECGADLVFKRVANKPVIGITAAFPTSQLLEDPAYRGINYLTSVLLLYGNQNRTYNQLLDYCSQHGIQLSVSASDEVTIVKLKCFNESLYDALQIFAEIVTVPLFPREHFLNIQKTLIANIDRMKDYPSNYATYLWKKQLFGKDSNLLDREGIKSTINRISRKKVVNWFHNNYLIPDMSLAIVGDFSFNETIGYINRLFKDCHLNNSSSNSPQISFEQPKNALKYKKEIIDENNGAVVHIGGFCCTTKEIKKNTSFYVLSQILGGDINSRLYDELREKRGLAYNVAFGANSMSLLGYFVSYAIVDKKSVKQTVKITKDIFKDIIENGVTSDELIIAKNSIRGQRLRSEESVSSQASTLSALYKLGFDYDFYMQREERLQQITAEDVRSVAEEYLQENDLYIHILV